MSLKALKKLTCVCSLLLLAAFALGSDLTEFRAAVEAAESEKALDAALLSAPDSLSGDATLAYYFENSVAELAEDGDWSDVKNEILQSIDGRIAFEKAGANGQVSEPKETAGEILKNPLYVDRQERKDRNWLDNAGTRIGERILNWLRNLLPDRAPAVGSVGAAPGVTGLTVIAWFLLGAVIILILYFVFRNFKGVGRRRKRVGGILEDDEPERTADQWLVQAEKLEAEGKYREAVRCLYIACLVRYDDGRVARFRRHETNWEHLYRIESSPQNPSEIDFRTSTQRFDKVWYGYMVRGPEDVAEFREVYKRLCEALQIKIAA